MSLLVQPDDSNLLYTGQIEETFPGAAYSTCCILGSAGCVAGGGRYGARTGNSTLRNLRVFHTAHFAAFCLSIWVRSRQLLLPSFLTVL